MVSEVRPLLIQSSPANEDRLRLDKEARAIMDMLANMALDQGTFTILHAATRNDILSAMRSRPYSIVQFSGHGHPGGIFVEAETGDNGAIVSVDDVEHIFKNSKPTASVLILMSCHSAAMAERLVKVVPIVITIEGEGNDDACIEFTSIFYGFLLRGESTQWSYEFASFMVGQERLKTKMMRRSEVDLIPSKLIKSSFGHHGSYYVDVSEAECDISRLNLDKSEFYETLRHKIRFHNWVFRYPRDNVLLAIGEIIGRFSWEDAEDRIYCRALYKIRPECPDDVCSHWLGMLIDYHDLYIQDYRSPNWKYSRSVDEKIFSGLHSFQIYKQQHFDKDNRLERIRSYIDRDIKAPIAMFTASLETAEQRYKTKDYGGCVQQMETALSALHDALEGAGKSILL